MPQFTKVLLGVIVLVLFLVGPRVTRATLENVGNQAALAYLAATPGSLSFRDNPLGACGHDFSAINADQPAKSIESVPTPAPL